MTRNGRHLWLNDGADIFWMHCVCILVGSSVPCLHVISAAPAGLHAMPVRTRVSDLVVDLFSCLKIVLSNEGLQLRYPSRYVRQEVGGKISQ